ncbi:MAG: Uncharacterized protein XD63_1594 [Thermoanaerobacterales bacterium 50_218]|nr:MAG: Uncharacterized protein XD63_1594 [Thermoanaerobacterales bacterium 50_218]
MRTHEEIKPAVFIYVANPDTCAAVTKWLGEGLEEEGVPFEIRYASGDAEVLAAEAARGSRLGVGIGVGSDGKCVLQHRRLPANQPLAQVPSTTGSRERYRLIGSHAARLVKNLPLKEENRGS